MPALSAVVLTALLGSAGAGGTFDPASLRAVELDSSGSVLNSNVPFQFDPDATFDPLTNAAGTMMFLLEGQSAANTERTYHLYFDTVEGGQYAPVSITPRVVLTDNVIDEGQASYQIQTDEGTYYYQKESGGFSSLLDVDGNDWISHNVARSVGVGWRCAGPGVVRPGKGRVFRHVGGNPSVL